MHTTTFFQRLMRGLSPSPVLAGLTVWLVLVFVGCGPRPSQESMDELALYTTREVVDTATASLTLVPSVDHMLEVPASLTLEEKMDILLDSLSVNHFGGLKLEVLSLEKTPEGETLLRVNLAESPDFVFPDSLGQYHSWYEYFQGSMGGQHTSIVLEETVLQREYPGDWVDRVEFYYRGEPMGTWDHAFLQGEIRRRP